MELKPNDFTRGDPVSQAQAEEHTVGGTGDSPSRSSATTGALDPATAGLVSLAVSIAVADEPGLRQAMVGAVEAAVPPQWVEELLLQSYMFCGFPRCLNATREWRRASGLAAPAEDEGTDYDNVLAWRERGEQTCRTVYGRFYERLRSNVRGLHPSLEEWMVVEGYGKLLGRPALDLRRRELCIVAICAADMQERQLHSHLHGAINAGATYRELHDVLHMVSPLLATDVSERFYRLLDRVVSH